MARHCPSKSQIVKIVCDLIIDKLSGQLFYVPSLLLFSFPNLKSLDSVYNLSFIKKSPAFITYDLFLKISPMDSRMIG